MLAIALNSPAMTFRMLGTTESSLSARRMRSARRTENCCEAGTNATLTITKSKMFQPLRKKPRRYANIFIASSTTNIAIAMRSSTRRSPPKRAINSGEVSSPSPIALITITAVMK